MTLWNQLVDVMRPRFRRGIAAAAVAFLILYALFGFWAAPRLIAKHLPTAVSDRIGQPVRLGGVSVNPFSLSVEITGLVIGEGGDRALFQVSRLAADVDMWGSLFAWGVSLDSVTVDRPQLRMARDRDGRLNLMAVVDRFTPEPVDDEPPSRSIPLVIGQIGITRGDIRITDQSVSPVFETRLDPIDISILALDTRPDRRTALQMALTSESNETIAVGGTVAISDGSFRLDLNVSRAAVAKYGPYASRFLDGAIQGRVSLKARIDRDPSGRIAVSNAGINGRKLAWLAPDQSPRITVPDLTIDGGRWQTGASVVTMASVSLSDSTVNLIRNGEGGFNLLDGLHTQNPPSESQDSDAPAMDVAIDRLNVKNLSGRFTDAAPQIPVDVSWANLNLAMDGIHTASGHTTDYRLDFSVMDKATFSGEGQMALADLAVSGNLTIAGLPLPLFRGYFPTPLDRSVTGGRLDLAAAFDWAGPASETLPDVTVARLGLADARLISSEDDTEMVTLAEVAVTEAVVDPGRSRVTVGGVNFSGGTVRVVRSRDGQVNLVALLPKTETAEPPSDSPPWYVDLATVSVAAVGVTFVDDAPQRPVTLTLPRIDATAKSLSTDPEADDGSVTLTAALSPRGSMAAKGQLRIVPVKADLRLRLGNLSIQPFQPYLDAVTGLTVVKGTVSGNGRLKVESSTKDETAIRFAGAASVNHFDSVDTRDAQPFVSWEALAIDGIRYQSHPPKLDVAGVALSEYATQLVVADDGTVNLNTVIAGPQELTATASPSPESEKNDVTGPPMAISVEKVSYQGGRVAFVDRLVSPAFETDIIDLTGQVTGLSSLDTARAQVDLQGRLANYSPVAVTGQINPFPKSRYADIRVDFSDIDLGPFSPYSQKFLGRVLDKGKLTLALGYLIDGDTLTGTNRLFFDQLTLGGSVDSPDATSLPLDLAIALLTDRGGRIELDMPVTGDLSDPEFKIGKVVIRLLVNLITKVVTAPFAALGSVFGGADQPDGVTFDPGTPTVAGDQQAVVDRLAEALYQRPALRLDIQGQIDPVNDSAALRQIQFETALQTQWRARLLRQGKAPDTVMPVETRTALIDAAFASADLPKPKKADGKPVPLSPSEKAKLLQANEAVSQTDLRGLAMDRAGAIKDYLVGTGKVGPERLFIREPDPPADDGQARVVFGLK